MADNFFTPIGNTKPYLKVGFQGPAGSGKSFTGFQVALITHKAIKSKKPIVLFDTEKAAKFLQPIADKEGVQVVVRESKTFADLIETMKRMRAGFSDVLVIDSISSVYEDFMEAYLRSNGKKFMSIKDWGITKPAWRHQFSEPFVDDAYHIVMCGRVKDNYEMEEDDDGKKTMMKSGVKMRGDAETAYEPDLVIQMNRKEEMVGKKLNVYREAVVLKGRGQLLDGATIKNPQAKDFLPTIEAIIAKPMAASSVASKDTAEIFGNGAEQREYAIEKDRVLDEMSGMLIAAYPSTKDIDKQGKILIIKETFGAFSWATIQQLPLRELQAGFDKMRDLLALKIKAAKETAERGGAVAMSIEDAEKALHASTVPSAALRADQLNPPPQGSPVQPGAAPIQNGSPIQPGANDFPG